MKRLMIPAALVVVLALGSYAIFAEQSTMPQSGSNGMMSGGMSGGMMDNMNCCGCATKQAAVAATNDGGAIVVAAGKLIKYDAALKKVREVDIDVDWNATNQKMQQDCPMMQMMK
jgi:hypothetical protein